MPQLFIPGGYLESIWKCLVARVLMLQCSSVRISGDLESITEHNKIKDLMSPWYCRTLQDRVSTRYQAVKSSTASRWLSVKCKLLGSVLGWQIKWRHLWSPGRVLIIVGFTLQLHISVRLTNSRLQPLKGIKKIKIYNTYLNNYLYLHICVCV